MIAARAGRLNGQSVREVAGVTDLFHSRLNGHTTRQVAADTDLYHTRIVLCDLVKLGTRGAPDQF